MPERDITHELILLIAAWRLTHSNGPHKLGHI